VENRFFPDMPVLVVDDEKIFLSSIDFELRANGITNVDLCLDSREVMAKLKEKKYALVLLDLLMPNISGEELLLEIADHHQDIPVIVVTAHADSKTVKNCMKMGAFDYLLKPFETKDLIKKVQDALGLKNVQKEILEMKDTIFSKNLNQERNFPDIITTSEKMRTVFQTISLIAVTSRPVLIQGETGVGKELVAREIHKKSRRKGEFGLFDTTKISDDEFIFKLFGETKGTGSGDNKGKLSDAQNGTLFIKEIGDLSFQSQTKLLRHMKELEFPTGDSQDSSNARIIAATTKNLPARIKTGDFREDLYSFFEKNDIYIPPLRERKGDIKKYVDHFIHESSVYHGIKTPQIPKELYLLLEGYDFPGNVGELKRMINEAVRRLKVDVLSLDVFLEKIINRSSTFVIKVPMDKRVVFEKNFPTFDEMEAIYFAELMKLSGGNKSTAARLAGLNITSFIHHLKKIKKNQKKE
jgi:DNA-binding NtrC family response regulator